MRIKLSRKQWEFIGKKAGWGGKSNKPENDFGVLRGTLNLKEGPVNFSVGWDEGYDDYTIYFPSIEISSGFDIVSDEFDVNDQVLRISEDPEKAKGVFDMVSKQFGNSTSMTVYDVYKKVERYLSSIY